MDWRIIESFNRSRKAVTSSSVGDSDREALIMRLCAQDRRLPLSAMQEIGSRKRNQPAPPRIIFEALTQPNGDTPCLPARSS
jgi:hypothetical protein